MSSHFLLHMSLLPTGGRLRVGLGTPIITSSQPCVVAGLFASPFATFRRYRHYLRPRGDGTIVDAQVTPPALGGGERRAVPGDLARLGLGQGRRDRHSYSPVPGAIHLPVSAAVGRHQQGAAYRLLAPLAGHPSAGCRGEGKAPEGAHEARPGRPGDRAVRPVLAGVAARPQLPRQVRRNDEVVRIECDNLVEGLACRAEQLLPGATPVGRRPKRSGLVCPWISVPTTKPWSASQKAIAWNSWTWSAASDVCQSRPPSLVAST